MRMKVFVLTIVALMSFGAAQAALEKGDNEVEFTFNYTDTDEVGSTLQFDLLYGWFLTENHEIGLLANYFDISSDVADELDVDGGSFGGFYRYNFGGDVWSPFLGARVSTAFGDLGDAYDLGYGVEAGARYLVGDHAAIVGRLFWEKLQAAEDFIEDSDTLGVAIGLSIHY